MEEKERNQTVLFLDYIIVLHRKCKGTDENIYETYLANYSRVSECQGNVLYSTLSQNTCNESRKC